MLFHPVRKFGADRLHRVRPISFMFPYVLVFSFSPWKQRTANSCRSLNISDRHWSSDGDVQPLQLVSTRTRDHNIDPCRPWCPFYEFVLQHSLALCHVSESSTDFSVFVLGRPISYIRCSSTQRHSLRLTAVFHSPSGIPCSGAVSARVAPTPCPQFDKKSVVFSLDQSFCAVMISKVFKVRLMEMEKSSGLRSVIVLYVVCPV